jgi:hypothetical protein
MISKKKKRLYYVIYEKLALRNKLILFPSALWAIARLHVPIS